MKHFIKQFGKCISLAGCALMLSLMVQTSAQAAALDDPPPATFEYNYLDGPGVGFNDPTLIADLPVIPFLRAEVLERDFGIDELACTNIGFPDFESCLAFFFAHSFLGPYSQAQAEGAVTNFGENPGTTLGELRRNVYELAASQWAAEINSDVPITVQAKFDGVFVTDVASDRLDCTGTGVILGQAFAASVIANFEGALYPNTFYPSALANRLAGEDLRPGDPGTSFFDGNDDIATAANPILDDPTPACIAIGLGGGWYYGFDSLVYFGSQTDLLSVAEHELGHGLAFSPITLVC